MSGDNEEFEMGLPLQESTYIVVNKHTLEVEYQFRAWGAKEAEERARIKGFKNRQKYSIYIGIGSNSP